MAHAAHATPPLRPVSTTLGGPDRLDASPRFVTLTAAGPSGLGAARTATTSVSLLIHAVLVAALVIVPLLFEVPSPLPSDTLRAFFVTPEVAPAPPPPPPPPAAGPRARATAHAPAPPATEAKFTAPIETPTELRPQATLDLGVEGGVPGGVEGGVPGGVVGGVVGGLPLAVETPPPSVRPVRVGGSLTAPKLVHSVPPEYPSLAANARLEGLVILEAEVNDRGHVVAVTVLRGFPILNEAAIEAVRQWRYKPLLLNGIPTPFILTVTVTFKLKSPTKPPME